jgi:PDZ domain-containing protein
VKGRPGGTVTVTVTPAYDPKLKRALIGIVSVANFPFDISIQSGDIGGPSAGLMWTLGLIDILTPGDLTGGRTIAGTGEIGPDGTVYPIGGIEEKVVAARRAGADVFLVPVDNAAGARSVAREMTIVPVKTYRDALKYLRAHA